MSFFKRSASAVAMGVLFTGSLFAGEMSLGVKGGLNLAKPVGLEKEEKEFVKSKSGFIGGVQLSVKLSEMFTLQPEVMYSMKGVKVEADFMGTEMVSTININYIEIPVLCKITIPAGGVTPNFYVGPEFGIRAGISGEAKVDDEKEKMSKDAIKEMEESTNAIDFGLAFGGGIEIPVGSGAVIVDVRYTLGLMQIDKLTDDMEEAGMSKDDLSPAKNGALSFMVGYAFGLGE